MADSRHYVVIGGGIAGLASAVWLAEAGKKVTLLERRGSLGGRTHAMKVEQVDDLPDDGQHVIASGYHHLFHLDDPEEYPDTVVLQHFRSLAEWATDSVGRPRADQE